MRNGPGLALLMAATGFGCNPPGDDFLARRHELERQFATLRNELDGVETRLAADGQRLSEWELVKTRQTGEGVRGRVASATNVRSDRSF